MLINPKRQNLALFLEAKDDAHGIKILYQLIIVAGEQHVLELLHCVSRNEEEGH